MSIKTIIGSLNAFYVPAKMLVEIDNKEVVKNMVNTKSRFTICKTINTLNDRINMLAELHLVRVTVELTDVGATVSFSEATSLSELVNSNAVVANINVAIAVLLLNKLKAMELFLLDNRVSRVRNFSFFDYEDNEKENLQSPITLQIPNLKELENLRKEYQRRIEAIPVIEVPLPDFL